MNKEAPKRLSPEDIMLEVKAVVEELRAYLDESTEEHGITNTETLESLRIMCGYAHDEIGRYLEKHCKDGIGSIDELVPLCSFVSDTYEQIVSILEEHTETDIFWEVATARMDVSRQRIREHVMPTLQLGSSSAFEELLASYQAENPEEAGADPTGKALLAHLFAKVQMLESIVLPQPVVAAPLVASSAPAQDTESPEIAPPIEIELEVERFTPEQIQEVCLYILARELDDHTQWHGPRGLTPAQIAERARIHFPEHVYLQEARLIETHLKPMANVSDQTYTEKPIPFMLTQRAQKAKHEGAKVIGWHERTETFETYYLLLDEERENALATTLVEQLEEEKTQEPTPDVPEQVQFNVKFERRSDIQRAYLRILEVIGVGKSVTLSEVLNIMHTVYPLSVGVVTEEILQANIKPITWGLKGTRASFPQEDIDDKGAQILQRGKKVVYWAPFRGAEYRVYTLLPGATTEHLKPHADAIQQAHQAAMATMVEAPERITTERPTVRAYETGPVTPRAIAPRLVLEPVMQYQAGPPEEIMDDIEGLFAFIEDALGTVLPAVEDAVDQLIVLTGEDQQVRQRAFMRLSPAMDALHLAMEATRTTAPLALLEKIRQKKQLLKVLNGGSDTPKES